MGLESKKAAVEKIKKDLEELMKPVEGKHRLYSRKRAEHPRPKSHFAITCDEVKDNYTFWKSMEKKFNDHYSNFYRLCELCSNIDSSVNKSLEKQQTIPIFSAIYSVNKYFDNAKEYFEKYKINEYNIMIERVKSLSDKLIEVDFNKCIRSLKPIQRGVVIFIDKIFQRLCGFDSVIESFWESYAKDNPELKNSKKTVEEADINGR